MSHLSAPINDPIDGKSKVSSSSWVLFFQNLVKAISTTAGKDTSTTQVATTAFVTGQAGDKLPMVDGVATQGKSLRYSREDHVHPVDILIDLGGSPRQFQISGIKIVVDGDGNEQFQLVVKEV